MRFKWLCKKFVPVALVLALLAALLSTLLPFANQSQQAFAAEAPQEEWSKTFGGSDYDCGLSVQQTSDGGYIIAGDTESYGAGSTDIRLIKVAPEEVVELWHIIYHSGGTDRAYGVAIDSRHNIIVVGVVNNVAGYHIVKYDANGNEVWHKDYSIWFSFPSDVAIDSQDNIIVTGYSKPIANICYYTVKMDKDGNKVWEKSYDTEECDIATGVAVDSEDNIIVTGYSYPNSPPFYGCYCTVKYDKEGNKIWERTYDTVSNDMASGIAVDSEDNIIVTGKSADNYYTMRYTKDGDEIWHVTYDSGRDDRTSGVAIDSEDNIIVTGSSMNEDGNFDYCTVKYDKDSNEIWDEPLTYDSGRNDRTSGVAIDSGDNIIVTGTSSEDMEAEGWCTIKYGRPSPAAPPSGGLSAGVIAGIAVGSCVVAGGIFFTIRKWVWKRG